LFRAQQATCEDPDVDMQSDEEIEDEGMEVGSDVEMLSEPDEVG
jgi:hypothetical protein